MSHGCAAYWRKALVAFTLALKIMRVRFFTAVFLGGIVDVLATNVLTLGVGIYVASTHDLREVAPVALGPRLMEIMQNSLPVQATVWTLGAAATVAGGYLAARIARSNELLAGALSAWLCVSIGLYSLFVLASGTPLWQHLLAFVVSPAAVAFGGLLRQWQQRRSQARSLPRSPALEG